MGRVPRQQPGQDAGRADRLDAVRQVALTANYLGGAEQDSSASNLRHTFDLVGIFKAGERTSFGINADYGMEEGVLLASGRKDVAWRGAAAYLRAGLSPRFTLCGRYEVFQDLDGARTGTEQRLEEVTITPELRITSSLLLRADFRYDFSNHPVFQTKSGSEGKKEQPTITMNANFTF
jgi:hypothetical protein